MIKRSNLLSTAAALALVAFAAPAFATDTTGTCPHGEVCGLDLNVHLNTDRTFSGLGGVDLSNVEVEGAGTITVPTPTNVTNAIEINQNNKGNVQSTLHYVADGVFGNWESAVTAIGNNASIETIGNTAVEGVQNNAGNINAYAGVTLYHVGANSIDLSVTGVGNNASVDSTGDLIVDMLQNNTAQYVQAATNLGLYGAGVANADLNVDVTAIGNNFSGTHNGTLIGSIVQENCANINAAASIEAYQLRDPINVTAVGNNISIKRAN